jgi:hypothetical protein
MNELEWIGGGRARNVPLAYLNSGLLSDRSCIGHANDSKLILNGDNMEEPVILGTTKHSTIVKSNWILTYSNTCWSRRSLNRSLFARKAA